MIEKSVDVVVVGFGGAGASAAITAYDAGAKVLVIEKDKRGGGNTRLAGGTIREFLNVDKAVEYFSAIFKDVSLEMNRAFVEEAMKSPDWMREQGAELKRAVAGSFPPAAHVVWPHLPGSDGIGGRWHVIGDSSVGGVNLWAALEKFVAKRNIEVLYNVGAKKLLTNNRQEVIGLLADGPDGEILIKSSRAVVLTCGGFQQNKEMQRNYLGIDFDAQGCIGNSGDGIKMAQELGADLWHMTAVSCGISYKFPEFEMPMGLGIRAPSYIYVDQDGKRFLDECGVDVHAMAFDFTYVDHKTLRYPRMPGYVILDEKTFRAGRLIGWCPGASMDQCKWSDDNSIEVEKGWIKTASSIRKLALEIGIDPLTLQKTVSTYNLSCHGGYDPEFDRRQETLVPIDTGPFYAIEIWPSLLNTQGGPKRNERAQIIHVNGTPIKRLYSAGELGSIFSIFYPGAGNISECLAFGRIAGRNAASEQLVVPD